MAMNVLSCAVYETRFQQVASVAWMKRSVIQDKLFLDSTAFHLGYLLLITPFNSIFPQLTIKLN